MRDKESVIRSRASGIYYWMQDIEIERESIKLLESKMIYSNGI